MPDSLGELLQSLLMPSSKSYSLTPSSKKKTKKTKKTKKRNLKHINKNLSVKIPLFNPYEDRVGWNEDGDRVEGIPENGIIKYLTIQDQKRTKPRYLWILYKNGEEIYKSHNRFEIQKYRDELERGGVDKRKTRRKSNRKKCKGKSKKCRRSRKRK
jgi:hypothetical protein